jgi:multisubunit Na+/H+ antiporter MnhF subunit
VRSVNPLTARVVGAIVGAILAFLGLVGIDTATETTIAAVEAFAYAIVAFVSFIGYGLSHKFLDRGKDQ